MPKSDLHVLARRRQRCTGEKLHRAVAQLRALAWQEPLPLASPAQAQLELEVLTKLGRGTVTDRHGWRPGDDPFALSWVTPLPEALEIGATPFALPDVVAALMPYAAFDGEPSGVLGLRARHCAAGVELFRLDLPGRIRLPGVSANRWRHAVAVAYADVVDVAPAERVWQSHPRRMHPEEEATARLYSPGYAHDRDKPEAEAAGSALLRRHLLFRNTAAPVTGIDVWRNGDRIELEWYDGPTHTNVLHVLLDPLVGLPGAADKVCRCPVDDECWSVRMRWAHAAGARLNLRRGTNVWDAERYQISDNDRARRLKAMRQARDSAGAAAAC
jgi:hypothetical protein